MIAQTDLAEPGIGDDGDDVEDEEAEGRETRAEPEHKKDRKAQFGGRAQPGSQYGRQERHRILALKESQRGRPARDLGEPGLEKHQADHDANAEIEYGCRKFQGVQRRAVKRKRLVCRAGRFGIACRGKW
ncbi:conserved hypothetical protein [Ricinus communis]|uniref:Uncharacterized protein n=1 Tax=Ricinus communis TaxID=3988 RepID=B9TNZ7_RICCO|nr:conserved hypothetical protein [Ricinus communis]